MSDLRDQIAAAIDHAIGHAGSNRGTSTGLTTTQLADAIAARVLPAHKAAVLREFADLIDRGPSVPLPPRIYSTLAREKADDAVRGDR